MKKSASIIEKTALKSIITSALLKAVSFNINNLPDLSIYKLLLNLEFQAAESLTIELLELKTF
jgi:hypothetical protein